jgi:hypothetical protein
LGFLLPSTVENVDLLCTEITKFMGELDLSDDIFAREMVPNPGLINILLITFDRLKNMLDNY